MFDNATLFRIMNLVLYTFLLAGSVYWCNKNHGRRLYAVPAAVLSIHGIIFYLASIFAAMPNEFVNYWSIFLRMHSVVTVLVMMWAMAEVIDRRYKGS